MSNRLATLFASLMLAAAASSQAANVVGGSTLLTGSSANQIETWLGEGGITLTNIYSKQAGDTSADFHAAVDGKGRTFVVMFATEGNGNSAIIGGYNNISWNSDITYAIDLNLGDGNDAFIFNLSTGVKNEQTGIYATYNAPNYGPTFGGGHDIHVNEQLLNGYSYGYSYGAADTSHSIVDGSIYNGADITYGAIEVFTISPAPVPEPSALLLAGAGLGMVGFIRRRPSSLLMGLQAVK